VRTPEIMASLFKNYNWHFSRDTKNIYLTFDDGPITGITPWVLNQLKIFDAKATFFCIGDNAIKYPNIFNNIITEGHTIGNHTFNHIKGLKTATDLYIKNTEKAHRTFNKINPNFSKKSTLLFRPPYGKIRPKQTKILLEKGYAIILWDVLSRDFDTKIKKENCLKNVLENTKNGSIVVFHDSYKASEKLIYTLPKILEYYTEKGFKFKAI